MRPLRYPAITPEITAVHIDFYLSSADTAHAGLDFYWEAGRYFGAVEALDYDGYEILEFASVSEIVEFFE